MALPGVHQIKFAKISTSSSGDTSVVAAVAGKRITVINYTLVSTSANSVKFTDGAGGVDLTGAQADAANGGVSFVGNVTSPAFQTSVGTALVINLSGATLVAGHLAYIEEG